MRAYSSYFRRKNSKKGLALSTTMAICIVLAILVALLVSMASLNITTTQTTVSQREAYLQAKSALSFVESYYTNNGEEIPGAGETSGDGGIVGKGIVVFDTSNVSDGARFYITEEAGITAISDRDVESYKTNCPDTYVEVVNSYIDGEATLTLNAVCKYGNNNAYTLARDVTIGGRSTLKDNAFTGSINYSTTNLTRYVRFHVRATTAFDSSPYFYMWYNQVSPEYVYKVNSNGSSGTYMANPSFQPLASSSIINKLTFNRDYSKVQNGAWSASYGGPTGACAMTYEGNGWYVTQKTFNLDRHLHFVNGIVTKTGAMRTKGDDQQSWEFFGIPIPEEDQLGAANGVDIYFEINQNRLMDMKSSGGVDDFTKAFQNAGSGTSNGTQQINNFAKFCGQYYTVYTKNETAIVHYRESGVTDDSKGRPGFTYEGYGWWRDTKSKRVREADFTETAADGSTVYKTVETPGGDSYYYGDGAVISQNQFGKERVLEMFVCYDAKTRESAKFLTEEEANDWFIKHGDLSAGNYVEVNVRAAVQPVDAAVETKITYEADLYEHSTDVPSYPDNELDFVPTSANADEELKVLELKGNVEDPEVIEIADAANGDFYLIGTMNDYQEGVAFRSLSDRLDKVEDSRTDYAIEYKVTPNQQVAVIIVQRNNRTNMNMAWDNDSNSYRWWGQGGNWLYYTPTSDKIRVTFNTETEKVTVENVTGGGGDDSDDDDEDKIYSVVGWMNKWGTEQGTTVSIGDIPLYELTADMEMYRDVEGCYVYSDGSLKVTDGEDYYFKIAERPASQETGEIDWTKVYGDGGAASSENASIRKLAVSEVPGVRRDDGTIVKMEDGGFLIHEPIPASGKKREHYVSIIFDPVNETCEIVLTENTSREKFYALGEFDGWADNDPDYSFLDCEAYEMTSEGAADSNKIDYSYTLNGLQEVGTYKIRVFGSDGKVVTTDDDGNTKITLDYAESWGAEKTDGTFESQGVDTLDVEYTLTQRSYVTINFRYYLNDPTKSEVTTEIKAYQKNDEIKWYHVGFHNGKVESVNPGKTESQFEKAPHTKWDQVYVTFYTSKTGLNCFPARMVSDTTYGENWWADVPEDADYVYFSNLKSSVYTQLHDSTFEYTENIVKSDFISSGSTIFFPITPKKDSENRTMWTVGDTKEYNEYINRVTHVSAPSTDDSGIMAYYGSTQCNYYDAPIVNVLNMLKTGDPSPSTKYAFACYPYKNFEVGSKKIKINFNENDYIMYQGEKYYWAPNNGSNALSFLIVQNIGKYYYQGSSLKSRDYTDYANVSNYGNMWGYMFEGEMSLTSHSDGSGSWSTGVSGVKVTVDGKVKEGYYHDDGAQLNSSNLGGRLYQDDRAGGVFASDEYYRSQYYDSATGQLVDAKSPFNYGGYTPSWYTYRIPVSSEVTIKNIKGVSAVGSEMLTLQSGKTSNDYKFSVVRESTNVNRPIYIYKPSDGDTQTFTYNINQGVVDSNPVEFTGSDGKKHITSDVSVYFDNSTTNWNHVMVHAYNPVGTETYEEIFDDPTTNEGDYLSFVFREGKYAFFQFYEGLDSLSASERASSAGLEQAEHKSQVLYLTGEELQNTSDANLVQYVSYDDRTTKTLAVGEATGFTWYMHPRIKLLRAYLDMDSVVQMTSNYEYYSYDSTQGTYHCSWDMNEMADLRAQKESYESAYKDGNDGTGKWKSAGVNSDNSDLLAAAQYFMDTVQEAQIYLSDDISECPTGSTAWFGDDTHYLNGQRVAGYVFMEGEQLQNSVFYYKDRWVNGLKKVYQTYLDNPVKLDSSGNRTKEYFRYEWKDGSWVSYDKNGHEISGTGYWRWVRENNPSNIWNSGSGLQNADGMRKVADALRLWLDNPQTEIKSTAVQIIVNDSVDSKRSTGGWGKENIHLYVKPSGGSWMDYPADICTTTQSNYYAFAFELDEDAYDGAVFAIAKSRPNSEDKVNNRTVVMKELHSKQHYRFTTAKDDIGDPKSFDNDTSTETRQFTGTSIIEGTSSPTSELNEFSGSEVGKKFNINFKYDTQVESSSGIKYTIYAGVYEISESNYSSLYSDFGYASKQQAVDAWKRDTNNGALRTTKNYYGIDLYKASAMAFFTDPKNYGMSSATTYSDKWSTSRVNSTKNIDLMIKSITIKGDAIASAPASGSSKNGRQVSFRYNGQINRDTLTVEQNIKLMGGTVVIACNRIDFTQSGSYDFTIQSKEIEFKTDTVIVRADGTEVRIDHGQYVFNEKSSSRTTLVSLKSTLDPESDWRANYALVSEAHSELEGGLYVFK